MSTEPPKDEASPIRKLTPEEERKGFRTVLFIVLGFFLLNAAIIAVLAR